MERNAISVKVIAGRIGAMRMPFAIPGEVIGIIHGFYHRTFRDW
jgi:hypothetical protein